MKLKDGTPLAAPRPFMIYDFHHVVPGPLATPHYIEDAGPPWVRIDHL
jgi:hypothetical protein